MARAKRTERATARRRYRAATEPAELETEDEAAGSAPSRAAQPARPSAGAVRMGIVAALRASIHPLRVRDDLAALPSLMTHKALWLPVLVTVASTVAVVATGGKNSITAILFAYFVQTPAIGGVFLAGFLAPRASWLLGAIVGIVAAIGYVAVLTLVPGSLSPTEPGAATIESIAISAFLLSPVMGALFASAAAWYRRFLSLSNPNRGRRNQPQKRVGDGRTRGSSAQKTNTKAPARR
ncbi:MAG: hypothetical protein Q7S35_07915 [Candidatus Limnocylindrales bacterium]|nr:hypothetical protein [Candidatus Limnocylindrales bacterium]